MGVVAAAGSETPRDDADTEFLTLFKKAAELAECMDMQISKPRTAESADDRDGETFYRVNMFLPLIEGVSRHLRDRFGLAQCNSLVLSHLIPANVCNASYADILLAVDNMTSTVHLFPAAWKWSANLRCGKCSGLNGKSWQARYRQLQLQWNTVHQWRCLTSVHCSSF